MLRTNSTKYLRNWERYLEGVLDEEEGATLADKLHNVADRFRRTANYPHNLRKFPHTQARLADWLVGLPLGFPFYFSEVMRDAAMLHDAQPIPGNKQDAIFAQWFSHCALMLIRVAKLKGVEI
jgi:hypothetical protein